MLTELPLVLKPLVLPFHWPCGNWLLLPVELLPWLSPERLPCGAVMFAGGVPLCWKLPPSGRCPLVGIWERSKFPIRPTPRRLPEMSGYTPAAAISSKTSPAAISKVTGLFLNIHILLDRIYS